MKKIRLESLCIENFKGIRALEIQFEGENCNIYGTNGTGKTTIYDAFLWLLFNKDSSGRKDFALKPIGKDGNTCCKGIMTSVTGVFDVDGKRFELKKEYYEKWTRKTGQAAEAFTGHSTDYFIDELPVKKEDYTRYIEDLLPEQVFRLVTNPRFFNEGLKWEERRKILFEMCSSVGIEELITGEYTELKEILEKYGLTDARKFLEQSKKRLNNELKILPERIDEAEKGIREEPQNTEALKQAVRQLNEEHAAMIAQSGQDEREKLRELESQKCLAQAQLRELVAQNEAHKANARAQWKENLDFQKKPLREARERAEKAAWETKLQLKHSTEKLHEVREKLGIMRETWKQVAEKSFEGTTVCPTCGQSLPAENVAESKRRFHAEQKKCLSELTKEGKLLSEQEKELQAKIANLEANEAKAQTEINEERQTELDFEEKEPLFNDLPNFIRKKTALEEQIQNITLGQENLRANVDRAEEMRREQLEKLTVQIEEKQAQLAVVAANEQQRERVQELVETLQRTGQALEDTERKLYLCEQLVQKQARATEERVNQMFEHTRFTLFETQINGGLKEICVATWDGVPYPEVNSAGKINCGLDILKSLSNFYGVQAPVFVDNAESVVDMLSMECQLIRLVVSEKDCTLRVE